MAIIKSLVDQVYDYISTKVKVGDLNAGEKIDEAALIQEMGISRTPIREALLRLASDGILESVPRKGFFVRSYEYSELLNAFAVIACLETFAAKCALKVLTELDFKKLEHMIWEMNIALDERNFPHYVELQEKFHAYCANATGNKTLIEILNYVKRQYPRQSYYSKEGNILYAALGKSNAEHAEILQALRNKDIAKIEELLTQHWCWQKPEAHTMGRTPSSPAQ